MLVTDVFMPVLSGITLVEKIRAEPTLAALPVVVITAGGEREREKLAGLGVSVFLRKPVSYQDVVGAIRTLLEPRLGGPSKPRPAAPASAPGGEADRGGLTAGEHVAKDATDAKPASRR